MPHFLSRIFRFGRRRLSSRQRAALAETLRADCNGWPNSSLRKYVLGAIERSFGNDFEWCNRVVATIAVNKPTSRAEADRIIDDHEVSRNGNASLSDPAGAGWGAGAARHFLRDAEHYTRSYVLVSGCAWKSFEKRLPEADLNELWTTPEYEYSGTRNSLRSLHLRCEIHSDRWSSTKPTAQEAAAFRQKAETLIAHACPGSDATALLRAIPVDEKFTARFGQVLATFYSRPMQYDHATPGGWEMGLQINHD